MSVLDKYELETVNYGTTGWNGIMSSNMQKLETHIHSRLLVTIGENFSAYQAAYLKSDGKFWKAQADATPAKQPAWGLIIETASAEAADVRLQRVGPVTNGSWSWSVSDPVYLSRTSGELTQTPPANAQMMGFAMTTTKIFLIGNFLIGGGPEDTVTTTTSTTSTTTTSTTVTTTTVTTTTVTTTTTTT